MDILLNLLLILPILYWFYKLKETENPYIYIGILVLGIAGLVISTTTSLYVTTGIQTDIVYSVSEPIKPIQTLSTPITVDLDVYNYVLILFYLMSIIGSVVYWSLGRDKALDY